MDSPARRAPQPEPGRGALEVVVPDPASGIRCHSHDWPHPLARWHHHPEIEIHLIRESSGARFVGDDVGPFFPGDLCLIGSGVPHNWITLDADRDVIARRDGVVQFTPERFAALTGALPDLASLAQLIDESSRGILLSGTTAHEGARVLEEVLLSTGPQRVIGLLQLLDLFASAPAAERTVLSSTVVGAGSPSERPDEGATAHVNAALAFITAHLDEPLDRDRIAAAVSLSPSSLSRLMSRATGCGISATVSRLRVSEARRHLHSSSRPIAQIAADVGFANLSTFNRQFRGETGMSPREYRRWMQTRRGPSISPL